MSIKTWCAFNIQDDIHAPTPFLCTHVVWAEFSSTLAVAPRWPWRFINPTCWHQHTHINLIHHPPPPSGSVRDHKKLWWAAQKLLALQDWTRRWWVCTLVSSRCVFVCAHVLQGHVGADGWSPQRQRERERRRAKIKEKEGERSGRGHLWLFHWTGLN